MFSRFFINRPIFAAVVALLITLAGALSAASLPIAQFPLITPPTVLVQAQYPGASAEVVASTVADPIEEQVNGVEGMLYMQSQSAADGSYALTVTFDTGTDVDIATVLVQNRVAIAMPRLPEEVQRLGVTTQKQSTQIVGAVNLISPDGRFDNLYLSNYATLQIVDELNRLPGVGYTIIFGQKDYSMRLWLDPQLLQARRLTADEVVAAVREQNVQVAAGQIGEPPVDPTIAFQYTVNTLGRLSTVEQFENIIVKTEPGGRLTRIKDVGKVELGALSYSSFADLDGEPTIGLGIFQLPEANALDVINAVRAKMAELEKSFPEGLEQKIVFDTTLFVTASIREVIITLTIAFVLVFIAVFIFLQDIRATLVPMITIPVALVGTFAVMAMLGFSINMLTLFGLVLAIGIVVDDAIVVVENTTRVMAETGKPRREATVQAMDEITGPIVGITLVLMAVFIPTAFLGGIPGQLYRQFALTIAASTFFSALNALTLSPALCAIFLHPEAGRRNFLARGFNAMFGAITRLYTGIVHIAIRLSPVTVLIYLGLVGVTVWAFLKVPKGFMPEMDQGYMFVVTQLPESASLTRTSAVVGELEKIFEQTPGVANTITVGGYSALDGTRPPNMATTFLVYKPWDQRKSPDAQQAAIVESLREKVSQIEEALVFPFVPPAIRGLGSTGGFEFVLQDRGGVGLNFLGQLADEFVADGNAQSGLTGLFTSFRAGTPQLFVDIDRVKVKTLGIPLTSVFDTLQTQLGSTYVNDLTLFNHTFQVTAQAETSFRAEPDDIGMLHVRAPDGRMVPLDTLATVRRSLGPRVVSRYNMYPSATINGGPAPGYSSGQAIQLMDQMAESKMPTGFGYQWTSMAYQEIQAGQKAPLVFAIAVIFVLLVLAAQYESWLLPVAVVLAVPIALLGAVAAVFIRNMDVNIYTQIGIILLIALAAKNAILIVEFARDARATGKSIVEAAVEGARLRLRPILMTSFAFILGVMPLVWATGAGASLRQAMGTAVFGGMIAGTFLAIFFIPVFYVLIQGLRELRKKKEEPSPQPVTKPAQ